MFFKSKLTPEYFIKRAIKAKSVDELANANAGLINLWFAHVKYTTSAMFDAIKSANQRVTENK